MRIYKLVLLLKSELKKEEKTKLIDEVKVWIGKPSKEKVTEIGERKLAYPVKKKKKPIMFFWNLKRRKQQKDWIIN